MNEKNVSETRERKVILRSDTNCRCNPDPGPLAKIFDEMAKSICIHDFTPSRIVKSGPCTIVFWKDGSKTVVRCPVDTVPNDYEAFTAALAIKVFGTNSQVKKLIRRLTVIQPQKAKKALDGETE